METESLYPELIGASNFVLSNRVSIMWTDNRRRTGQVSTILSYYTILKTTKYML